MKKKLILLFCGLLLILSGVFLGSKLNKENLYVETSPKQIKQEDTISMMVEQTAETGDYMLETRTSWPALSDGYKFNSTLSKCENCSLLSWNNETNSVVVTGNVSDKCYVYFDKIKLITFTISNTSFYAEDGMTWQEFINSDFNDGNFSSVGSEFHYKNSLVVYNCMLVYLTNKISSTISYGYASDCKGALAG